MTSASDPAISPTGGIDDAALRLAVLAVAGAARPPVGRTGLDQILRGLDRVRERYGGVPGFGSAGGLGRVAVLAAIDDAIADGELVASAGARSVLRPPRSGAALRRRPPSTWPIACATGGSSGPPRTASRPTSCSRMPASRRSAGGSPSDEDELLDVPGMGPARIERYGRDLLELVRAGLGAGASRPPMPV